MLFRTLPGPEGQDGMLMMAIHCPNDHPKKRMLLFEMDERNGQLRIVNECTGNWFSGVGGKANFRGFRETLTESPVFSRPVNK